MDAIVARGDLADYHHLHSARADLLRRLGRVDDAIQAYERAWALTLQAPEKDFLMRRMQELKAGDSLSRES
jgi:RNA polymerase sigma-70 factor (ECF subfamily)